MKNNETTIPCKTNRPLKNVLVTGGAGFIGSNFIRYLLNNPLFKGNVINYDVLTYAGNIFSLADISASHGVEATGPTGGRYRFIKGDICDSKALERVFADNNIDTVVHFAAESHVDRSILGPLAFVKTNVLGTATLLDVARNAWRGHTDTLFHHVSTDEVYGSLGDSGKFEESTPYDPRSPYSASKAASDHLVRAFWHTYGLPVTISNCSNNYGPFQFPEKLIPLMIRNMVQRKPLPVYGNGSNVRDWLYVEDHNSALFTIIRSGLEGETYNIGGDNEWKNIDLVRMLCSVMADETKIPVDSYLKLINFVGDRPGHDLRYSIDCSKIKKELGWTQSLDFAEGLRRTVRWYLDNKSWIEMIETGEYREWIKNNYLERGNA